MAKKIKPEQLGDVIQEELKLYGADVRESLGQAALKAIKSLVAKTKATAPVGYRGKYKSSITYEETTKRLSSPSYTWGAKGKEGRLTHLLVHGHAKRNGGRTRGNKFLENALAEVLEDFEKDVREAIQKDD